MSFANDTMRMAPHPEVDIFRTWHQPYYIFSLGYIQKSAGFRVYYYLCHILNELGYEAYVIDEKMIPGLRTPVLTNEIWMHHRQSGRHPIVIYGEATRGNPLQGDVVIRWILNSVGHIGSGMIFEKQDLIFYWRKTFAKSEDVKCLCLPQIDRKVFNREGVNDADRSEFCYYANKYFEFGKKQNEVSSMIRDNCMSLCHDIERTHDEIADILRHSRGLFCYEPSAIVGEALLCGCPVVFVKTEYLDDFNMSKMEIQVPMVPEEEIDFENIPNCVDEYCAWFDSYEQNFWGMIRDFIAISQAKAKDSCDSYENDAFIAFCEKQDAFYIYGAGIIGKQCCHVMRILGYKIIGFIVSDEQTDENAMQDRLCGLPVFRLSQIEMLENGCAIVLAMRLRYIHKVIPKLDERGFANYIRYSVEIN